MSTLRVKKRIIVCCDGTWQDGVLTENQLQYTNVLRLARTINHEDDRHTPSVPQIVFYQSGVGSEKNFYAEYVEGATGCSLANKVEEAYAFIAHNYHPGDEIFLFGFSRGAYTARMVAMFIGAIGLLDRKDMEHFAHIFVAYQKLGKSEDAEEIKALREILAPFNNLDSHGKLRAGSDDDLFSVKCVGVFDTVGSLGLPEELTLRSKKLRTLFGFPDRVLGEHVERAYQALALNETRKDFDCARFEQTETGRLKGQVLKQCWFTGAHSDIGGGYEDHDLADLTLTWLIANIEDILSVDIQYLLSLPQPVAPWGFQQAHDPATGIFSLASQVQRSLPVATNAITHETIHRSVLNQVHRYPALKELVEKTPHLVAKLLPLEVDMKQNWGYDGSQTKPASCSIPARQDQDDDGSFNIVTKSIIKLKSRFGGAVREQVRIEEEKVVIN